MARRGSYSALRLAAFASPLLLSIDVDDVASGFSGGAGGGGEDAEDATIVRASISAL